MFVSKWAITSKSLNIIPWIKKKLLRPKIEIFAAKNILIGFDLYGPIIELNLAFLSEHQDLLIRDFTMMLKHGNNEWNIFEWQHLSQQLHLTKVSTTDIRICKKKYPVLLIKLNQTKIEERLVTCQNLISDRERLRLIHDAKDLLLYHEAHETPDGYDEIINSQQILKLTDHTKEYFDWDRGKYTIIIKVNRCETIDVIGNSYSFSLSDFDIEHLKLTNELVLKGLNRPISELYKDRSNWNSIILPLNNN